MCGRRRGGGGAGLQREGESRRSCSAKKTFVIHRGFWVRIEGGTWYKKLSFIQLLRDRGDDSHGGERSLGQGGRGVNTREIPKREHHLAEGRKEEGFTGGKGDIEDYLCFLFRGCSPYIIQGEGFSSLGLGRGG